jgi:hypothetical protein
MMNKYITLFIFTIWYYPCVSYNNDSVVHHVERSDLGITPKYLRENPLSAEQKHQNIIYILTKYIQQKHHYSVRTHNLVAFALWVYNIYF